MTPHPAARLVLAALLALPFAVQAQLKPTQREGLVPRSAPLSAPAPAAQPAPAPAAVAPAAATPSTAEIESAGQTAAHAWLLLLDRKDWGTAWEASSGAFRQSVPLGAWMDNVPKAREPMGAFVERQPVEAAYRTSVAGRPEGHYVTAIFQSRFSKKEVQEVVTTTREPDGRWRVMGYTYTDR